VGREIGGAISKRIDGDVVAHVGREIGGDAEADRIGGDVEAGRWR
jgi:hypothetical protein